MTRRISKRPSLCKMFLVSIIAIDSSTTCFWTKPFFAKGVECNLHAKENYSLKPLLLWIKRKNATPTP